jgi:hypothetical protein
VAGFERVGKSGLVWFWQVHMEEDCSIFTDVAGNIF